MNRLEEIRQRIEVSKAQKEKGDSITAACLAWSIVANDIPYLLSEVDRLTARAEAAEARADAAVKDLGQNGFCGSCSGCNAPHDPNNITWCYSWEWRGPVAEKGEME